MLAFLHCLKENYGGAEQYFKNYGGMSSEQLARVKQSLLQDRY